ncbi:MAG: monosaccharide transporter rane protein family [Pseudonocardiales bacterium]|nr:monosaccharide transporter rane protein family [Pseudonocardiales bacterium]
MASEIVTMRTTPRTRNFGTSLGRYQLIVVLVFVVIVFTVLRPNTFGTSNNFAAILNTQVTTAFLALGATLPFIAGEFDLSVAATASVTQVLVVGLVLQSGWNVGAAAALAVTAAIIIGLLNGIAVAVLKISSFIATLAMSTIATGIMLAYSKGQTIYGNAPASLTRISQTQIGSLQLPVVYLAAITVVLAVVLGMTAVGRRLYATGSNQRAAQLTGIATKRYILLAFVVAALFAAAGGILQGARLGSATPDTSNSLLIPAFAGAFLGATGFLPGRFNILGTITAIYIVGVAINGLQQIGAPLWVQPVFNGAVLFVAVGLSALTKRMRSRAARGHQLQEIEERARLAEAA